MTNNRNIAEKVEQKCLERLDEYTSYFDKESERIKKYWL